MCVFLTISMSLIAQDEFNTDRLPIGNPDTKYDFCAVKLDKVFDTNANEIIQFDQLINKLKAYRIIMIGESHTLDKHHQVQLNIIKGLVETGSSVCLALEMFNPSQNEILNNYTSGKISEQEFLDQADYFNTWGHNYRYYKPIFDFTREHKIKMFGVNIEHDYASKIGRGGAKSLTEDDRQYLPEIDTTNVEHRFFIKVAMEGMDATMPAQFSKIYAAQSLWDAAMGDGAIKVATENPQSIVVVLAGSGHVVYNLGIGKIIKNRSDFPFASLVAIDIPDTVKESVMMKVKKSIKKKEKGDEEKSEQKKTPPMGKMPGMPAMDDAPYKIVVRSLADFLVGVAEEKQEKYPSFGFSVNEKKEKGAEIESEDMVKKEEKTEFPATGSEIKRVIPHTIAEREGLQKGDIILSIDGKDFADMTKLKQYLTFKNWGDPISFKVYRDGNEIDINFDIEYIEEEE